MNNNLIIALLTTVSLNSAYAQLKCQNYFDGTDLTKVTAPKVQKGPIGVEDANIDSQLRSRYDSPNIKALKSYNSLLRKIPTLKESVEHTKAVRDLLTDESLSTYHEILDTALIATEAAVSGKDSKDVVLNKLEESIYNEISKFMSLKQAKRRAALIKTSDINQAKLMQALGKMTQKESYEALVGKGTLGTIDPDSLVGRYLAEAKAEGYNVKTIVDTFSKGPDYKSNGGRKLFISVDDNVSHLANKYFGNNPHLLAHNHESGQGTLEMHFKGRSVGYAHYNSVSSLNTWQGSMIPLIVLSSKEGSNAHNYFTLGTFNQKYSKYPWGLKKDNGKMERVEYCRTGGYNSCTHWMGEAPIGEKTVKEYSFPGFRNDDSYGDREGADTTSGLRTAPVGEYNVFISAHDYNATPEKIGNKTRKDRLIRMVWNQKAGHEQLWSMVSGGDSNSLRKGEWANPGWVLYSLLGRSLQQRVPVVLIGREDATERLTRADIDAFEYEISPE